MAATFFFLLVDLRAKQRRRTKNFAFLPHREYFRALFFVARHAAMSTQL